jgi:flavin reductase (DIM6/NTAB) family NADH-FMN oxidoreductase RutF
LRKQQLLFQLTDTDEEPTVGLLTASFNLLGTHPEILVCNVGRERWNTPLMEINNVDRA